MSNFCEITLQWLQNGCPKNFKLLKYEHINMKIILKHIIWRFRQYKLFLENMSKNKFREIF